jgi:hypothetical protein
MPASPEQITALLSKYEAVIKRQAAEKKELEKIIDLLESNARIQAKLLADTGRERDEIRIQLVTARLALKPFALNVGAISLSKALGHITREHLLAAKAAFTVAEDQRKS